MTSVDDALKAWQEQGLIDEQKATELRAALPTKPKHDTSRAVTIFATIGAVLVGLGIILFVGSNWKEMGPVLRVLVLLAGYGTIVCAAHVTEKRGYGIISNSLWLLTSLALGANIVLFAQIFHHSLTYWQGPFMWMLGALAMAYARKSRAQIALAVPLGILALGWIGGGSGWFMDDQMQFLFSPDGLRPLFPVLGLGLISLSLLLRKTTWKSFASPIIFVWGTLCLAIPLIISTFHHDAFNSIFSLTLGVKQWLIIMSCGVLMALSLSMTQFQSRFGRYTLLGIAVLLCMILIQVPAVTRHWYTERGWTQSWLAAPFDQSPLYFGIYVIIIFALSLLAVWIGSQSRNGRLINVGLASAAVIITGQYFTWSFKLLDRSIAFILGGILLIGMSIFLEKQRRKLLSEIST